MGKGMGHGDVHPSRVNYLFQAGKLAAKMGLPQLSHYYGQVLTVITEKTAPKKDFTMKRSMCKRCHSVLQIGENATYRLRKSRHRKSSPNIVIGCLHCGERKRLPTGRDYRLNSERDGLINNGGGRGNPSTSVNGNAKAKIPPPSGTPPPPESESVKDNISFRDNTDN